MPAAQLLPDDISYSVLAPVFQGLGFRPWGLRVSRTVVWGFVKLVGPTRALQLCPGLNGELMWSTWVL